MRNVVLINSTSMYPELRGSAGSIVKLLKEFTLTGKTVKEDVVLASQMDSVGRVQLGGDADNVHSSFQTAILPEGYRSGFGSTNINSFSGLSAQTWSSQASQVSNQPIHATACVAYIDDLTSRKAEAYGLIQDLEDIKSKNGNSDYSAVIVYIGAGNLSQIGVRKENAAITNLYYRKAMSNHSPSASINSMRSHGIHDFKVKELIRDLAEIANPVVKGVKGAETSLFSVPSHLLGVSAGQGYVVYIPKSAISETKLTILGLITATWLQVDASSYLKYLSLVNNDEVALANF